MHFTTYEKSLAQNLIAKATKNSLKIATAESCTGGIIAALLTETPGSSKAFDRGFITYSNAAKSAQLNVPPQTLSTHGAVSQETAKAMAQGALKNSDANIAIATTGIAGPDGGSPEKPVGLVYIAIATRFGAHETQTTVRKFNFAGDRAEVRKCSTISALQLILSKVK